MSNYFTLRKFLLLVLIIITANVSYSQKLITVKGQVIFALEEKPILGASVKVKGTTVETITDLNGNYTIQATKNDILTFSYAGYTTKEVAIGEQTVITVALNLSEGELDKDVFVGYGTVKKSNTTGALNSLTYSQFDNTYITSPQELLAGKSAGVVITSAGGEPGSGSTIRIRGGSSLNASNDPLVVVDGMPIKNGGVNGESNFLSFIDPNEIASFTVLKDASTTSIYGSRASNGVIIINTKRGLRGQNMRIVYNGNVSIATPMKLIDVYSGDEFRKITDAKKELYNPNAYSLLGNANTDWQSEIFRPAISNSHNVSVTGAYKILPYRVSVGYTKQNGILKNTDMNRITGTLNLNPSFLKNSLKIDFSGKAMYSKHNFGDVAAINSAINMDPTQPVKDGNSQSASYFQWSNYGANLGTPNPVEQLMAADNRSNVTRLIGSLKVSYNLPFLKDLKATLSIASDYSKSKGHNNRPVTSPSSLVAPSNWGKLNNYTALNLNNLIDIYFNYAKNIGNTHIFDVTAGYSWQKFKKESTNYTRSVEDENHPLLEIDNSSYFSELFLVSLFSRLNYSLFNRYLLTAIFRYDGSSRFTKANRWSMFPSFAFAWKIHEERFFNYGSFVTKLKLRAGWGITGQQDIGTDYPTLATYTLSSAGSHYYIDGQYIPTLTPDAYDPNIKWEETITTNIGLDFGFADNRITGLVDFYLKDTKDLLNTVAIPSGSNFANTLLTNVGSSKSKGIELALNVMAISQKHKTLELGLNLAYNSSEITKLLLTDNPNYIGILYGNALTGLNQVTRVGYPAYSFFVNKQVYDGNGKPIEGVYENISGSGNSVSENNNNKYVYKKPVPDYLLGFSFRFNYKQFDLSASARANMGNYVYNAIAANASYDQIQQSGYWKNMPKYLDDTKFVKRQFSSDYFVEDAAFIKLDNLSLGYRIRNDKYKIGARISLTAQNLFIITKYKGIDPEVTGGIDNNFYPRPRTFMFGISLSYY